MMMMMMMRRRNVSHFFLLLLVVLNLMVCVTSKQKHGTHHGPVDFKDRPMARNLPDEHYIDKNPPKLRSQKATMIWKKANMVHQVGK